MKRNLILLLLFVGIFTLSSCASTIRVDDDFVQHNLSPSPAESAEPAVDITPEESTSEPTPKAPVDKPSGLVLNPDRVETVVPYQSDTEPDMPVIDEPEITPEPVEDPEETSYVPETTPRDIEPLSDASKGLKTALSKCGRTTTDGINFVAYAPVTDAQGGITIIHIVSNINEGTQKVYSYYESENDYKAAKVSASEGSYDDATRMILKSVGGVMPITDPEAVSYVVFDGYEIWR